jgi:phosphatidylinositol-3-phosphatase
MLSAHRTALIVTILAAALALFGATVARPATADASPCGHRGHSKITHVVVIAFENHNYRQVLSRTAPHSYFRSLAGRCGSAANFTAAHVPRSLPNYMAATSGHVTLTNDCIPGPGCLTSSHNIFGQLGPSRWRVWAESMPGRCYGRNTKLFVPRHSPAPYYTRISHSLCRRNVLPLPATPPRVHRSFTWVVPNLQHDMHDGSLGQASAWLHTYLAGRRGLLRSPEYRAGHTAVFIWFDTGTGRDPLRTPIPLIVISPHTRHHVFTRHFDNYSLLRAWQGMLHLKCMNQSCGARGMMKAFGL